MAKNPFGGPGAGAGDEETGQPASMAEIEAELKRVELETALLALDEAKERNAALKAAKAVTSRVKAQRQAQLKTDLREKTQVMSGCTHRQGGSPGRERKGSGPSALRVVILPDNRELVMCANCPMRVFSPLPANKSPRLLPGETEKQRDARVAEYHATVAAFEKLKELSQDQLTPEAGQPMHCGKTFAFEDGNGNQISMPAPCDSYSQGLDNRRIA
jgi:hypothetical protein